MFRRKRKRKYTWLPNWGTDTLGAPVEFGPQLDAVIDISNDPSVVVTGVLPMLRDSPVADQTSASANRDAYTMADMLASEYYVRRIVGKMYIDIKVNPTNADDDTDAVFVKSGIFIAKADSQGLDLPRDFATENFTKYSPLSLDANREPWLFQRSWLLGGNDIANGSFAASAIWGSPGLARYAAYPSANVLYGSALDGPHIDIKTSRRVSLDERLFACWSVRLAGQGVRQIDGGLPGSAFVNIKFDYRVLGALRKARQTGSF